MPPNVELPKGVTFCRFVFRILPDSFRQLASQQRAKRAAPLGGDNLGLSKKVSVYL